MQGNVLALLNGHLFVEQSNALFAVISTLAIIIATYSTIVLVRNYKTPLLLASTRGLLCTLSALLPFVFGTPFLHTVNSWKGLVKMPEESFFLNPTSII